MDSATVLELLELESAMVFELLELELAIFLELEPKLESSSMMLLVMQAICLKSSSNFFHMSRDSPNIFSRTPSKLSQEDLKNGSSKKNSLMVTGTLLSAIVVGFVFVFLYVLLVA